MWDFSTTDVVVLCVGVLGLLVIAVVAWRLRTRDAREVEAMRERYSRFGRWNTR